MKHTMKRVLALLLALTMVLGLMPAMSAAAAEDAIVLADSRSAVPIYIDRDSDDYDGLSLVSLAVAGDFEALTGSRSKVYAVATASEAQNLVLEPEIKDNIVNKIGSEAVVIIAGTVNDKLIRDLGLTWDITASGESFKAEDFERYQIQVVEAGGQKRIIVAGADKRGTSYGLFHITQDLAGISPWIWWADATPAKVDKVAFTAEELETVSKRPSVNYRGFFFNDENPNLDGFADAHFGGLNYMFYNHVFELMLRLKGNFLWPAMWSNSFNADGVEGIANANTAYGNVKNGTGKFAKLEQEYHYLLGGAMYVDQAGNGNAACGAPNVNTTNYTREESLALGDGSLTTLGWGEYPMTLANAVVADRYGIMIGASHHEPMARAGVEWGDVQGYNNSTDTYTQPTANGKTDKSSRQAWNYLTNPTNISNFWSDGVKRNGSFDNLLTIGMRGENDTALTDANGRELSTLENAQLLKDVIREQDRILRQYGLEDTPQLLALYKEVENCWYAGSRNSPESADKSAALYYDEEITELLGADTNRIVMFCEDNNGYLRTVGEYGEKDRFNYGLYYHFDYVGAPHTSMWTNTNPLQRTWDNMTTAYEYGVDDAWIVNVGDLKPMELPLSYFMEMAYDFETYGSNAANDTEETITWEEFTVNWVRQQFAGLGDLSEAEYEEIASILTDYTHLNGNRKPEQQRRDTYSLTSYNEAQEIMALAKSIEERANKYLEKFEGTALYDAYYQLVYYTAIESATVNQLLISWGLNQYYSSSGSALTNIYADKVDSLLNADRAYTKTYNTLGPDLNGQNKWYRMMITSPFNNEQVCGITARAHLNYSSWNNDSSQNISPSRVTLSSGAAMLVNATGSNVVSSGTITLPDFDSKVMQAYAVILSNKGVEKYNYTVSDVPEWIILEGEAEGSVQTATTLGIKVDWAKLTADASATIKITADSGQTVSVRVNAKVANVPGDLPEGTALMSNGEFSFIASNYSAMGTGKSRDGKEVGWLAMPGYGKTEGSVKPFPVYTDDCLIGEGPWLDYKVYVPAGQSGSYQLNMFFGQSNDISFFEGKELNFGLQVNGGSLQKKNALENNYISGNNSNGPWNSNILNCGHVMNYGNITLNEGVNTIRVYAMDQNLLLQKVVISRSGSFKSSYTGAPQSYRVGDPEPSQKAVVMDSYVDHEHEYTTKTVQPTCTAGGTETRTCTICNTSFVVNLAPLGHDWDEGKVLVEATTEKPGSKLCTCGRCGETKTVRIPRVGATIPDDIDFTVADSADRFEIINPATAAIRPGQGLYLESSMDAFEDCNEQLTGSAATTPKDLVQIPVEGDWVATMKFRFNQSGNGYYEFFGFYAMDDYNNVVGIRGGDGTVQDFLRLGGTITREQNSATISGTGMKAASTHWFRIVKVGDTYTCYWSVNDKDYVELFTFADTGIEGEYICIDAYTGMSTGYTYLVESLTFSEEIPEPEPDDPDKPDKPDPTELINYALSSNGGSASGSANVEGSINNVIDGNRSKNSRIRWASEDLPATLTITLSEVRAISTVDVISQMPDSAGDGETQMGVTTNLGFKEIVVSYSEDGSNWIVFGIGDPNNTDAWQQFTKDTPVNARYIKIDIEQADTFDGWARVLEVQVLGTPVGADEPCKHDYKAVVTEPTCEDGGYTTYTCSKCGDSYKDDETEKLGHKYEGGECTVCGKADPDDVECPGAIFSDMPAETHWAHKGIDYCIANKLMNGTGEGKFNPGGTLTRAELVTILYRVEGTPAAAYKGTFQDVKDGQWYTAAIEWAAANKIVNGVGDGTNFSPSGIINREQIATILYRYDAYKNGETAVEGDLKAFPDAADVSSFAATAMIWANQQGIINGVTVNSVTKLAPKNSATREQIASIMMRYLEAK